MSPYKFESNEIINMLKFTKGLKYFLNGFSQSQKDIEKFIYKCKESENNKGYLTQSFYELVKIQIINLHRDHLQKKFLKL